MFLIGKTEVGSALPYNTASLDAGSYEMAGTCLLSELSRILHVTKTGEGGR